MFKMPDLGLIGRWLKKDCELRLWKGKYWKWKKGKKKWSQNLVKGGSVLANANELDFLNYNVPLLSFL